MYMYVINIIRNMKDSIMIVYKLIEQQSHVIMLRTSSHHFRSIAGTIKPTEGPQHCQSYNIVFLNRVSLKVKQPLPTI